MSLVRTLSRVLVVLALLGTVLALAASPASAQDLRVIIMENLEADDDTSWQVRVQVISLGGCTPEQGLGAAGFQSTWFGEGNQVSTAINTAVCTYRITAQARTKTSEVCEARLAWGADPQDGDYMNELNSATATPEGERRIKIKPRTTTVDGDIVGFCAAAIVKTFTIDPDDVVEELPRNSRDDDLEERVKRAVEVTDFKVRVRPDESTKRESGCNVLLAFTMQGGEDGEVKKNLEGIPAGTDCKFRVSIINDPAPFVISDRDKTFTTDGSATVDLGGLVRIEPARIAIIQDVVGSAPDSGVSYSIARTCAGVNALPPAVTPTGGQGLYRLPGGGWRVSLTQGRYTVHSDLAPNFGAGATYQAAARSLTSNKVDGCSVTVAIEHVPQNCSVLGGDTQTLTWRTSRRFENFDFEFDITCNGATVQPSAERDLPPAPPTPSTDAPEATAGDSDVRIVARELTNGKIEFGLQQLQHTGSWGTPQLPRTRLFPTTAGLNRWLVSSPLTVSVAYMDDAFSDDFEVRIAARRLNNGRVEFALQERRDGGSWGGVQLPTRRFFPASADVDRWLRSSVLDLDS